jgi:hypothetical protein
LEDVEEVTVTEGIIGSAEGGAGREVGVAVLESHGGKKSGKRGLRVNFLV